MGLWQYIGLGLTIWVIYDLMSGHVYFPGKVSRKANPYLYWVGIIVYSALAISCFFGADYII